MRFRGLLAVAFAAGGCSHDPPRAPDPGPSAVAKPDEPATLRGVVRWTGAKVEPYRILMTGEASLEGVWPDGGPLDPRFVVAADGGLPHAFVWASEGPHVSRTWEPPAEPRELVAARAMYAPHVLGLMTRQPLTLRSADGHHYCFHARPRVNKEFNVVLAPEGTRNVAFTAVERAIPISDDVHTWMNAWAFVLDHPFFATTDASGRFEIRGLPPGDYVFTAWHESMTPAPKGHEAETRVTLASGATADVSVDLR